MFRLEATFLAANITSCVLVLLLSLPGTKTIVKYALHRYRTGEQYAADFYQDKDGEATKESIAEVSKKVYPIFNVVFASIGCATSLVRAVLAVVYTQPFIVETWVQFGIWLFLVVQGAALLTETLYTARFFLGLMKGLSCLITIIDIGFETYTRWDLGGWDDIQLSLMALQTGLGIATMLLSFTFRRRPDVFRNGTVVDRELTTSVLGRLSFSWAYPLIRLAAHKGLVHNDQLPELDLETRAKSQHDTFTWIEIKTNLPGVGKPPLWRTLLLSNLPQLIPHIIVSGLQGIVTFAPHLCLLQILRLLEQRSEGAAVATRLIPWVIGLAVSIGLSSLLENWNYWIAHNKISLRVYEQLSTIVFSKAMRLDGSPAKTIKGTQNEKDKGTSSFRTHNAVNLMAVDASRIVQATTLLYNVVLVPLELAIAFVFSQRLLGWKSFGAGIASLSVLSPVHHKFMKESSKAEKKLLDRRDEKITALTEAVQGIQHIKFASHESRWEAKLNHLRNSELLAQTMASGWKIASFSLWILTSISASIAALSVYATTQKHLPPSVAFTTISILITLQTTVSIIPDAYTQGLDAWRSLSCVRNFLDAPERKSSVTPSETTEFVNATVAWPSGVNSVISSPDDSSLESELPSKSQAKSNKRSFTNEDGSPSNSRFMLIGLNAQFPKHGFSIISGPTGSGKSLVLASLLGESDILSGVVKTPLLSPEEDVSNSSSCANQWLIDSAMAYVPQIPWIETGTIKENILFGLPFTEGRYKSVIAACALMRDFERLKDNDNTEIGANGANLSSGQKARISLARALYSRAGMLIIDDVFSAVDASTARHLYEHALTGELVAGRTRILATRHVRLCLPRLDYLMYLDHGVMNSAGMVDHDLLDEFIGRDCDGPITGPEENHTSLTRSVFGFLHQNIYDRIDPLIERVVEHVPGVAERIASVSERIPEVSGHLPGLSMEAPIVTRTKQANLEQEAESSNATWRMFYRFIQKCGGRAIWVPVALTFPAYMGLILAQNFMVIMISKQPQVSSGISSELKIYLGFYGGLSTAVWIVGSLGCFFTHTASLAASRRLFQQVLPVVLHTPLVWLDTVPLGRILGRLSADYNVLDSRLGMDLAFMLCYAMEVLVVLLASIIASPLSLISAGLLISTCIPYARRYLTAAWTLKRVESITRTPVYEHLDASMMGLSTIRAYGRTDFYIDQMHDKIDRHARACWQLWLVNRWLNFRLNVAAAVFPAVFAIIVMVQVNMSASFAGFALSFVLHLSSVMAMGIKAYANFELDMNSVERLLEYTEIKTEEYEDGDDAPQGWPKEGRVEVCDLSVQYAPGLPTALQGLNFHIEPNQRIGIVGRTGSGKSTIALALFRFLEAQEGHIRVDGMDISKMKLSDLRSRMAIIPQNPTLFAGTVRSNLDPFGEYEDEVLLQALKDVQWIPEEKPVEERNGKPSNGVLGILNNIHGTNSVSESLGLDTVADSMLDPFNSLLGRQKKQVSPALDTAVADGGLNFSQGQRQLLCLARSMISSPKILVLDEATSSMDNFMDEKIRKSLRGEKYASTTRLVIAHRLRTVADFDRILVLDGGRVVEFGSPKELIDIQNGVFRKMVKEDLERECLEGIIYAD